jgi:hypothetical protein
MIGIKMPPPWAIVPQQSADEGWRPYKVYHHPDGRFAVGIEKEATQALRGHGARGHIIIGTICHYIEGPSLQSVLDRAAIVSNTLETLGYKAEVQRVIEEIVDEGATSTVVDRPAVKCIIRRVAEKVSREALEEASDAVEFAPGNKVVPLRRRGKRA